MTKSFNNPKVSVMIITYNQEHLIGETIDSVLVQDYDNLEIIVADDASTDQTPKIILDYAGRYPGKVIPHLNPKNLGITGNSNSAFFACTGEFVAILGGDDIFLPKKISEQVKLFNDPEVVLSYHSVDVFLHQTNETLFISNTTANEDLNTAYDIISKGGIPGASSVMVRRSACPDYGFDMSLPVVSDWLFFIEVAMKGKIAKLPNIYGRYRKHGQGASERTYELLEESLRTLDIIKKRYPNDMKLKAACRKGIFRYVLGELFRQAIKGDRTKINSLRPYLVESSSGLKRYGVIALLNLLKSNFVFNTLKVILPRLKNYLKRKV